MLRWHNKMAASGTSPKLRRMCDDESVHYPTAQKKENKLESDGRSTNCHLVFEASVCPQRSSLVCKLNGRSSSQHVFLFASCLSSLQHSWCLLRNSVQLSSATEWSSTRDWQVFIANQSNLSLPTDPTLGNCRVGLVKFTVIYKAAFFQLGVTDTTVFVKLVVPDSLVKVLVKKSLCQVCSSRLLWHNWNIVVDIHPHGTKLILGNYSLFHHQINRVVALWGNKIIAVSTTTPWCRYLQASILVCPLPWIKNTMMITGGLGPWDLWI